MVRVTIAISGQPGAGKSTVAKQLSTILKIEHFTIGKLWKALGRGKVEQESYYPELKKLCDEKNIILSIFQATNDTEAANVVWNSKLGKNKAFHEILDKLQKRLAEKGNIIIEGKLAIHMIKNANLKIWIKADFDKRVQRISERDNLSLEESEKKLKERDRMEREEWMRIYGFDSWEQEKEANIVIDSSDKTPEQIIEIIILKLKEANQ